VNDPAIIEAAAQALQKSVGMSQYGRAEVILAAVTPLIEAAVLEKAAKVAEDYDVKRVDGYLARDHIATAIAAAIRALKEQPAESSAA
jgi:hypothetical protein